MKKLKVKNLVIFGVLGVIMVLVVLVIGQVRTFFSGATSDLEPQSVTAVPGEDGKSAIITWVSDKESIAKVEYGTTAASLVLMSAESSPTTSHNLTLSSLKPATTYYYRIRVGEDVFDNGGIPYTFKTKADTGTVTSVPLVTPTTPAVNVTGGVCDATKDYNGDGSVNSMDLMVCKKNGGAVPTSVPVVTTTKATPTVVTNNCSGNIADYNSDGVINSLDRINCLQTR